jgi:hypothetical protein
MEEAKRQTTTTTTTRTIGQFIIFEGEKRMNPRVLQGIFMLGMPHTNT